MIISFEVAKDCEQNSVKAIQHLETYYGLIPIFPYPEKSPYPYPYPLLMPPGPILAGPPGPILDGPMFEGIPGKLDMSP
jgi:hypothetical protein